MNHLSTNGMEMPVVHLVDDNEDLRNALQRFIEHNGLRCCTYVSAEDFLDRFQPDSVGCIVLDIRMPGMSGLALQEHLVHRGFDLPVLVLTGHADVPVTLQAWHNGAFDLLQKPVSNQILLDKIRQAIGSHHQTVEQRHLKEAIQRRIARLTPREAQVMRLVVRGAPNKAIGAELGLSQKTVEVHRSHVMRKMGAASLSQLVRMAMLAESNPALELELGSVS